MIFPKRLKINFCILFAFLCFNLVGQEEQKKEAFENHKKGKVSIGINWEYRGEQPFRNFGAKRNHLDIGYHITDKWMIGTRLHGGFSSQTITSDDVSYQFRLFDLQSQLYSRYYIKDFGKRKRASWFAEGSIMTGKVFSNRGGSEYEFSPPEEYRNLGFQIGTGVDVALSKNILLTSSINYGRNRYFGESKDYNFSSNHVNLSLGVKWQIQAKKKK